MQGAKPMPPMMRTMEVKESDTALGRERIRQRKVMQDEYQARMSGSMEHNNSAAVPVDAHPKFGFHTMLNTHTPVPLPTPPAVVGGNVDWTKLKVTPATQFLQNFLASKRSMNPPPAVGSDLKLKEPSRDSIHTTI